VPSGRPTAAGASRSRPGAADPVEEEDEEVDIVSSAEAPQSVMPSGPGLLRQATTGMRNLMGNSPLRKLSLRHKKQDP
jgi:hypothetical protein